jgi:hypothetical protein
MTNRLLPILALFAASLHAQTITGSISGFVVDPSDSAVARATVEVINTQTGETRRVSTGETGEFVAAAMPPGEYTIKVQAAGFQEIERTAIVLTAGSRLAVGQIKLAVGGVTQTVQVLAQAAVVNTEDTNIDRSVNTKQLDELSIEGRDPLQLVHLMPGVTTGMFSNTAELDQNDPSAGSNGGQYGSMTPNVNGGRMFWSTVTVDGQVGSNPDWPGLFEATVSVDSVSELKVMSNNYTAEYGRNMGANITVVTKSGGRQFHGGLNAFLRNEDLNATNFFNNRDGLPKPVYRYVSESANIGGPIFVPGSFNRNREKLFFFYSQEEWQVKLPQPVRFATVPTALERTGDFSQSLNQAGNLIPITDPLNAGARFPNNVIPPSRLNPNGQAILRMMPLPNQTNRAITAGGYNFQWEDDCSLPKRLQALKTDYLARSNDRFSLNLRRWWSDLRGTTCVSSLGYANLPVLQHHYHYSTDTALVNWTHIMGANKTNEVTVGMLGEKERGEVPGPWPDRANTYFDSVSRAKLGFTLPQLYGAANPYGIMPQSTFSGIPNAPNLTHNAKLPGDMGYPRFSAADRFTWVRGGHTFKFGLDFEISWATDGPAAACGDGCFDFGRDTNNPGDAGWPFATALLGNFASYRETNLRNPYLYKRTVGEWFAQDTWKVSRRLTLTYGMRFAAFSNWNMVKSVGAALVMDRYSRSKESPLFVPVLNANKQRVASDPTTGQLYPAVYIGAYVPNVGDPFSGTLSNSDPTYLRDFLNGKPVQLSPRFGFAYDPLGDSKTVIRGGFGIGKLTAPSYGQSTGHTETNAPAQLTPQIFYGTMDTLPQANAVLFPGNTATFEADGKTPSVYNYSLGIQRYLGRSTVIDVSYVGNVAKHLLQTVDLNVLPYGTHFLPQSIDPTTGRALSDVFLRPIPGYQSIVRREYSGTSNYNSLQVNATRRFSRGVQFGVAYTWSKNLASGSAEGGRLPTYLSWRSWTYGQTLWDQTQVAVIHYMWSLPKASNVIPNPVVHHLFDNWNFSGITSFAVGFPRAVTFTTSDGADITGGGDGVRTVIVGDANLPSGDRGVNRWFNTAAFARPAQGTYGNAGPVNFRGPGVNNWNLNFAKRIPVSKETRAIETRVEMYNAFNHTQFSGVVTAAQFDPTGKQIAGRFGQVNAARNPRIIQVALRFSF